MLKIGITGGIGSGKTFVSELFEKIGIPVYSADFRARYLMNNSHQLKGHIIKLFGGSAYLNGALNRKHIAGLVFNNNSLLQSLNAIVHPAVENDYINWCSNQQGVPYILKEAAILFESNSHKNLDFTILVTAPTNIRIERVCKRDGSTPEEVQSRINNQWPTEKLATLADFIVENDNKKLILPQIIEIDNKLRR